MYSCTSARILLSQLLQDFFRRPFQSIPFFKNLFNVHLPSCFLSPLRSHSVWLGGCLLSCETLPNDEDDDDRKRANSVDIIARGVQSAEMKNWKNNLSYKTHQPTLSPSFRNISTRALFYPKNTLVYIDSVLKRRASSDIALLTNFSISVRDRAPFIAVLDRVRRRETKVPNNQR